MTSRRGVRLVLVLAAGLAALVIAEGTSAASSITVSGSGKKVMIDGVVISAR